MQHGHSLESVELEELASSSSVGFASAAAAFAFAALAGFLAFAAAGPFAADLRFAAGGPFGTGEPFGAGGPFGAGEPFATAAPLTAIDLAFAGGIITRLRSAQICFKSCTFAMLLLQNSLIVATRTINVSEQSVEGIGAKEV